MLLVVNFFMSLVMSTLCYISIVRFSYLKFNKRKAYCYILCTALLLVLIKNYGYNNNATSFLKMVSMMTVIILTTYFVLIKNIVKSFYYTVIIYTAVLINESIVAVIMIKLLNFTVEILQNNIFFIVLINLIVACLSYIEMIFIKRIWNKEKMTDMSNKNAAYILFALMTFVVTAANILVYNKYIEMIDDKFIFMNILITATYFLLTIAVHRVYSNLAVNEQENRQLKIYINMSEELIDEYRRVRHNTHNIIQAASAFIEENNIEGLKEHFSSVIERQNRIDKSSITPLYRIVHPGVKSLLSSKLGKIESLSLNLKLEIASDLKDIKVNISDLCEILGVFLDNSIEAAQLTDDKYIEICIFEDNQCYTIIINNSYDRSKYKKGNGIGLKTVKSILKKYPNMLNNTIIEEKHYTQELIIEKHKTVLK